MVNHWHKSFWTKLIAACFIGLVILGNIWLVQRFSLDVPPVWIQTCFAGLAGAIFVFGAALGAEQLMAKFSAADANQIVRENENGNELDREDDHQTKA
ncbi:MAG: hypothetical protein EOP10_24495 [Proteobacteria bacterium]|nr:MAG: hypothetical protein EOP10_24495 [Pseudomonadota bacterium]